MKTETLDHKIKLQKTNKEKVTEFYDEATEDYEFWSKDYNMHFGYFEFLKTNPFRRDTMLNAMNAQVFKRLQLQKKANLIADFGCGMGGTMRYGLKKDEKLSAIGVTLSPFQVQEGNKLLQNLKGVILQENYNHTSIKSNSTDGVIAVESLCHGGHHKKSLKEAYRILKPGTKLVVADAFLKKEASELCLGSHYCYQKLCQGWSLEKLGTIHTVEQRLSEIGFKNIQITDASFRVAPSVLHVPFAISSSLLKKIFKREIIKPQGWKNLVGSLFALLSGLHMKSFGYYIITAEK